ncbi:DEAD/DEAH box helicase family protein [Propioniciclava soli]|uniref:DEAD/DEAH box helicase family protein n=2 Tax=Propioniciclava soli TaxID=2775081 RepID=A0ABZ3CC63_9ACTN
MATKTTIHDVIEDFQQAPTNVAKGEKFERLMVDYFHLDPTLSATYDLVVRWPDWDHREGTHDSGIDLVARNADTGLWTAVQCKFFSPNHYLQKGDIDSFFTASGKVWDGITFDNRIIISTTDKWSKTASDALANQTIPVQRIGLPEISESPIDWMWASKDQLEVQLKKAVRYSLRPHQKEALTAIHDGFTTHDRGQWISACGTGKTFTSLKLAEQMCADNGGSLRVLFLAPSIALVSQTLREWMAQTQTTIRPFVVCSDTKASKAAEDISTHDIPLPTTNATRLVHEMSQVGLRGRQMTVVFSTYQSIDVVAQAQQLAGTDFDLVLCDEAHRTTGVRLAGEADESAFTRVHDNTYLPAAKRLYMTATPRLYGEAVKQKADEASAVLTSMDDEATFGPEFHRLGFGEAVERRLLADYKVMILVVENGAIAPRLQESLATVDHELALDDAAKIVGCWNGLAKRTQDGDFGTNPTPMKRAVAFSQNIRASQAFADAFPQVVDTLTNTGDDEGPTCEVQHVDGSMNAMIRGEKLAWLKAPIPDGECRVLTNARCLSEGVDVPALDAVMFLHPRNSLVDVVQSVGRVMRKAPGKEFGYVILPVAIPAGLAPEEALKDNKRFKVVWDVLNALRSHDDRFNAMINTIDLDKSTNGKVTIDFIGNHAATDTEGGTDKPTKPGVQLPLFALQDWKDSILARIVKKVGDREYWDQWADDVVHINANQTARITTILKTADQRLQGEFEAFHQGLRDNLNDSITLEAAVDMLSQHLITRPVFEALFAHDSFAAHNPVSITMQKMVDALAGHGLHAETAQLDKFYASVRRRAEGIQSAGGRQQVVNDLYEQFFKKAFPKQSESLGVVYTPIEIVDFMLRAADDVCRQEFGYGLTDQDVHILDPFTGTGTFIVRLLQSGIIRPEDLARKYTSELWANEIMLLAYYIACVNIETTYQAIAIANEPEAADHSYQPFPGATLTDTFQITEDGDRADTSLIPVNSERIESQLAAPIRIIVGNPPYSAKQDSANDDNANLSYPSLDRRIAETFLAQGAGNARGNMYDSYLRALRWSLDRLGDTGVLVFVANNSWIDGAAATGVRRTLASECAAVWVLNLKGNQRTAGETSRREGGKVFGMGSRAGVAVFLAIKRPSDSFRVAYREVADYRTREEKLQEVATASLDDGLWRQVTPNADGDWINQRSDSYQAFTPLAAPQGRPLAVFKVQSAGLKTNRDAWCYNFSRQRVLNNMRSMIDTYNTQLAIDDLERDPAKISWSTDLMTKAKKGVAGYFSEDRVGVAAYRPFTRTWLYYDRFFNAAPSLLPRIIPAFPAKNLGIWVPGPGSNAPFQCLVTNALPDLVLGGAGNPGLFFARWTYERAADGPSQGNLLEDPAGDVDEWGYRAHPKPRCSRGLNPPVSRRDLAM